MDEFEEFWAAYPKKRAKGAARRAWIKTASIRPPIAELMASLERAKSSAEWHRADRDGTVGAFIPHPASWLNAESWEDDYALRLPSIKTAPPVEKKLPPAATEEQKAAARQLMQEFRLKVV